MIRTTVIIGKITIFIKEKYQASRHFNDFKNGNLESFIPPARQDSRQQREAKYTKGL